jgi:hypothetical protein
MLFLESARPGPMLSGHGRRIHRKLTPRAKGAAEMLRAQL